MKTFGIFLLLGTGLLANTLPSFAAPPALPPPPPTYVLDEPHVLDAETDHSLRNILSARDQATGQQVVVAIFQSLQGEDLVDRTNRIFHYWRIGQKGKDNGVLLALYWQEHKARIEVGYGLEPILTDARAKRILAEFLIPELKANHPSQAITAATQEILKTIDSPESQAVLKANPQWSIVGVAALLLIGFLVCAFLFSFFSRGGSDRKSFLWGLIMGFFGGGGRGGGFGGGGGNSDGGGFSGGGGNSGGGGASGDW